MAPETEFPNLPSDAEEASVNLDASAEISPEEMPAVAPEPEIASPEESPALPEESPESPEETPESPEVAPETEEPLAPEVPAEPVDSAAVEPVASVVAAEPEDSAATEGVAHVSASSDENPDDGLVEDDIPHVEFTEDRGESAASSLLQEILGDEENLDSVVEKANPQELTLLMESIATRGDVAEFVSKIANIKKSFESKTDQDTVETSLLSRFNTALARFNKKRMAYYAEREKEKEDNSVKKKELLDRLKTIVTEEQVTKIQEVREIQVQWREIGWVLQKDMQSFNETYRHYLDVFYNLRGKYQDLLELDRKYNLDEKKRVVEEVESLIPTESDTTRDEWNRRSERVKQLQEYWRTIGHVPRDEAETMNANFRDTLDRFYEMRSGYYELQDQQRVENEIKKRAIIAKIKAHLDFASHKAREWTEITKEVLALQEEWKTIGPGPIETNKALWQEYRTECDNFFQRKSEFFKSIDDERAANLARKTAICEKAESLMNSENLRETTEALKALQEEWKTIGPVHERHSNKIWKRFRTACDTFFERRSAVQSASKNDQEENLTRKLDLISRMEAIAALDNPGDHADEFEDIQKEWKEIGHVPFKQKDKINGAYRDALDQYFDKTRARGGDRRGGGGGDRRGGGGGFGGERRGGGGGGDRRGGGGGGDRRGGSGGGDRRGGGGREQSTGDPVEDEIRRIRTKIQIIQEKVDAYETNILMITKGKSGDGLRAQIQASIDSEKAEIETLKKKIKDMKAAKEAAAAAAEAAAANAEAAGGDTSSSEAPVEDAPAAEAPVEDAPAAEGDAPADGE